MPPVVSVVLGSYNRLPFLKATLESIRRDAAAIDHEIIVVDGGSDDGTLRWLPRQRDVISIIQHNRGEWRGRPLVRRSWGYFMNLAFKAAQGKYVAMLSDDCLLIPSALRNGFDFFEARLAAGEKVGAVAFYWRNWPEQKDYWVERVFGDKILLNHGLYLRDALQHINWIDEDNYHFYHADGDLCLRLFEAGYTVLDCESAMVEHYSHANQAVRQSNFERQKQDWQTYLKRWTGAFGNESLELSNRKYLSYRDPHETVREFPRFEVLKTQIRYWQWRIKQVLLPVKK